MIVGYIFLVVMVNYSICVGVNHAVMLGEGDRFNYLSQAMEVCRIVDESKRGRRRQKAKCVSQCDKDRRLAPEVFRQTTH